MRPTSLYAPRFRPQQILLAAAALIIVSLHGCSDDNGNDEWIDDNLYNPEDSSVHECSQDVTCQDFTIHKKISPSASDPAKHHLGGYRYFMKVCGVDVIAETADERQNMLRVAKAFSTYLDRDGDGKVDSPSVRDFLAKSCGFTLLITHQKDTYKAFDDVHPNPYHQAFSTTNYDGEPLEDRQILEELLHFQQVELWSRVLPDEFGFNSGVVKAEAKRALEKAYVYDEDCTRDPSCLQPEFFFCAMTTLWEGWPDPDSPSDSEWRLKHDGPARVRKAFPDLASMLSRLEGAGEIPSAWPSVPSGEQLEAGVSDA